jgi:hypothetical protein
MDEPTKVAMVLYVSDASPASERARVNVAAVASRLGLIPGEWIVRNATTDLLTEDERASVALTPLLVIGARRTLRIAHELDDVDALERSLRPILERRGVL